MVPTMSDTFRVSLGALLVGAVLEVPLLLLLEVRLGGWLLELPLVPVLLLLLLPLPDVVTAISLAQTPSTEQRPSVQVRSPEHCSSTTSVLLKQKGDHHTTKTLHMMP